MTEKPIIFSAPMVRAILAGRKTQTRRLLHPRYRGFVSMPDVTFTGYSVGMRLWVKETFYAGTFCGGDKAWIRYQATDEADVPVEGVRWKPSIFMPRQLSRIALAVEAVRVERLQEISEEDALEEGVEGATATGRLNGVVGEYVVGPARDEFQRLWDSINSERATWESDPWVTVITFKRLDGEPAKQL